MINWVWGIKGGFRTGFRGGITRDLKTNQNKIHRD